MMRAEYDVLVAGAGASGLCAAAAAAREGAEVLLIEQSGIPGGSNTQSLVGPLMGFHAGNCQVIGGLAQEIVDRLAARGGTRGHIPDPLGVASSITPVEPEILKQVEFDLLREEKRITTLFQTALAGVQAEDGMIRTIRTMGKEGERSFSAKVFIDATGDGDLASGAGAPFLQGREEDGLSQPMTMIFKIGGVDFERIREAMRRRPDQFVLCEEWEKIPFTAVSGYFEEVRKARDEGLLTFPRDRVLLFEGVRPGEATVNMGRIVGRNPLNAEEKSRAEMEGHAQADEILRFLRERIDGFRDAVLLETGTAVGVRESRHIRGAYLLTREDILRKAEFEDAAAVCAFPIDIHDPRGKELTWVRQDPDACYDVPYRVMLPQGVRNLLVTGRCVSATHEAAAAVRITPTGMALGEAAGIAAAMAARNGSFPDQADISLLRRRIAERGGIPGKRAAKGERTDVFGK